MKKSDARIREYLSESVSRTESGRSCLQETIRLSKAAFYEMESRGQLSSAEFLYQQSQYIRKRWWILQGGLLMLLWILLAVSESGVVVQKSMGVAAPLFAVLLLPELWKNRNAQATEIEGTAFYSLRQIYAARIFLFALVDAGLLGLFSLAAVLTGNVPIETLIGQFFLPYFVTCCICFRTFYHKRAVSDVFALLLCLVWCFVWIHFILDENLYDAVSLPIWMAATAASALYLGCCIYRGQKNFQKLWEEKTVWN